MRVSASGRVQERVSLPDDVAAGLDKWGIEGVTGTVDRDGEHLFVALQRGLTGDDGLGGYAASAGTTSRAASGPGSATRCRSRPPTVTGSACPR